MLAASQPPAPPAPLAGRMRHAILILSVLVACGGDGPTSYGDDVSNPQLPPRGSSDLYAWLDAGHYQTWQCEATMHPPRPGSGHGPNRICSNDVLAAAPTGDGPYPVDAAAVKEVFDSSGGIRL